MALDAGVGHEDLGYMPASTVDDLSGRFGDDSVARDLFDEFYLRRREGYAPHEPLSAVRHVAYHAGLAGGPCKIDADARTAASEEFGPDASHAQVLEMRTLIALRALATLDPFKLDQVLGMIRARYENLNLEAIAQKYFSCEPGTSMPLTLKRAVNQNTPLYDLLNLLALGDQYPDIQDCVLLQKASLEFLIRRLISGDVDAVIAGSKFMTVAAFERLFEHLPNALSYGKIGRKAGNLIIAEAALSRHTLEFDEEFARQHRMTVTRLREGVNLDKCLAQNVSFHIGSGVFEQLIDGNPGPLSRSATLKQYYSSGDGPPSGLHGEIKSAVFAAEFPAHIERQLMLLFRRLHGKPIIVRSSSELEDRHGASFAGQYESVELANSGDFYADFDAFKTAIKKVYASVFSPDVMQYRAVHGLLMEDEEMGILIQNLNGERTGDYFYPHLSVVAMSHATQSIGEDPTCGAMRIAGGLGRSAVDEGGGRFAMFAKPGATFGERPAPQEHLAVLKLSTGEIVKVTPADLASERGFASGSYQACEGNPERMTFSGLLDRSDLPLTLEYIVQKLKYLLGHEVDCEFTVMCTSYNQFKINLVQCRPQNIPENLVPARMPEAAEGWNKDCKLVASEGAVNGTSLKDIPYALYIDPAVFKECTPSERAWISKYVAAVNHAVGAGRYVLLTPRRWGTHEAEAGLPARQGDFLNAAGVMEVFDKGASSKPSFGTHFLQVFLDQGMAAANANEDDVNRKFFLDADNAEGFPSLANVLGAERAALAEKLSRLIMFVDVNQRYHQLYPDRSGEEDLEVVLHLAQDNTHKLDEKRPMTLYFAPKGKYYPEAVVENGK